MSGFVKMTLALLRMYCRSPKAVSPSKVAICQLTLASPNPCACLNLVYLNGIKFRTVLEKLAKSSLLILRQRFCRKDEHDRAFRIFLKGCQCRKLIDERFARRRRGRDNDIVTAGKVVDRFGLVSVERGDLLGLPESIHDRF